MFNKRLLILPLAACLITGCGKSNETDDYVDEVVYDDYDGLEEYASPIVEESTWSGVGSIATDEAESVSVNAKSKAVVSRNDDAFSFDSSNKAVVLSDTSEAEIVLEAAMIAKNVSVALDVEDLDSFSENLTQTVSSFCGYFEESDVNDYKNEYATTRKGYFTIRIPSEKLDDFLKKTDESGTVTNKNISTEDVSLNYVDTVARIESLEAEKAALQNLMESAESVSEIITIQDRLTSVQYKLDSANGQKRYLEGRVDYSNVKIVATEERVVDNQVKRSFSVHFKEKLLNGMETVANVFVSLLVAIPTIVVITGFGLMFLWFFKKAWRKVFKKSERRVFRYVLTPVYEAPVETTEENK